jgi:iron complex outermembrane receptor protein
MLFRYSLPQPPFLTNSVTANAANAINTGVEITINAALIKNRNFTWDAYFNLGTLKNRITNLSGKFKGVDLTIDNFYYGYADGRGLSGAYISKLQVGHPAGVFWIPQHIGLDDKGHELYNNYDDAGKLIGTSTAYTDQDRVYIDPTPKFSWGITNNFYIGNFGLSFFLRGVQGQKVFANSLMVLETTTRLPGNNVTLKALSNGFTEQPQPSTYWLRDASFARLENLNMTYQFAKLKKFSTVQVSLIAHNLFVLTQYEGLDPEIKVEGSQRYIDNNYYPKTRSISIGFNVGF